MLLVNNKTILIYGLNEKEKNTMDEIVKTTNLCDYKVVEESMGNMKIRDILDGIKLEVVNCNLPQEKIILINNFSDEELNSTIKEIRQKIESKPILAVVTETSIDWTFSYLMEHLLEEREWFKKQRNG